MKNLTSLLSGMVLLGSSACYGAHPIDGLIGNVNKIGTQSVSPEEQKEQEALRVEAQVVASCIAYAELGGSCRRTRNNELIGPKIYSADAESRIPSILKSMDSNEDGTIDREELDEAYQRIPLKPDYCETIKLEDGKYKGVIASGKEVEYEVEGNGTVCYLWINPSDLIIVSDRDCNNTADHVVLSTNDYSRKQLEQLGYVGKFDRLLTEAQKIVCPKNKISKDNSVQGLDDIIEPYL